MGRTYELTYLCSKSTPFPAFYTLFWPWVVDLNGPHLWALMLCGFQLGSPKGTLPHRSKGGRRVRSGLHFSGHHPVGSPQDGWVPPQKDIALPVIASFIGFPFWVMDRSFPFSSQFWVITTPLLALNYWLPFTLPSPWKIVPL